MTFVGCDFVFGNWFGSFCLLRDAFAIAACLFCCSFVRCFVFWVLLFYRLFLCCGLFMVFSAYVLGCHVVYLLLVLFTLLSCGFYLIVGRFWF